MVKNTFLNIVNLGFVLRIGFLCFVIIYFRNFNNGIIIFFNGFGGCVIQFFE